MNFKDLFYREAGGDEERAGGEGSPTGRGEDHAVSRSHLFISLCFLCDRIHLILLYVRNQLAQRQAENKALKEEEIQEAIRKKEKLRLDQVRALGWETFDLSRQNMKLLPPSEYVSEEARIRLSYAIVADLSKNKLESLPVKDFLYWLSSVRHLSLSTNRLSALPDELGFLRTLEIFEARENQLLKLPTNFGGLVHLLRVDLSSNKLTFLPESIGLCQRLTHLSLHCNLLTHLPASIGSCMRLEFIDVSSNQLTFLPDEVEYLISLQQLHIQSNRLISLPKNIGNNIQLQLLNASNNNLAGIPESFCKLEKLAYLNLQHNNIVLNPLSLHGLKSLSFMDLSNNHITSLYKDIAGCSALTKLSLANNKLSNLPPEIGLLCNLEDLNLSYNALTTLNVEIGACGHLLTLNLSHNHLQGCLVPTIALLTKLVHLDISYNTKFTAFPENIIGMVGLKVIEGSFCSLSSFPSTLPLMKSLESLYFSNNRFSSFPVHLSSLSTLRDLNLADNLLTLLPKEMMKFTHLTLLDLSRNQLQALPIEFIHIIESVPSLRFESNPWTLYPPKWGFAWQGKASIEGSENGYDLPQVLHFMYAMKIVYPHAEELWAAQGHLYYAQRLSFDHFVHELKSLVGSTSWHEGLLEHVKFLFFSSREKGVFPVWYEQSEEMKKVIELKSKSDDARRQDNVMKSQALCEFNTLRTTMAYEGELTRRAKRSEAEAREVLVLEEDLYAASLRGIKEAAVGREKTVALQAEQLERERVLRDHEEYLRIRNSKRATK